MSLKAINQMVAAATGQAERSGDFLWYARTLAAWPDDPFSALDAAERERAPERIISILKSAVSAGGTSSQTWASALVPYQVMASGFLASLATISVWDALLNGGVRRVPLKMKIVVSSAVAASAVGEGMVKPISSTTLSAPAVEPRKTSCIIVLTDELVKLGTPAAVQLFNTELKNGVARATDATFIGALLAGVTPTASAGGTAAQINTDLGTLLAALSMGDTSKPYLIMPPATARGLTLKLSASGDPAFPSMGLFGGEVVNGLPALVSDQCPAGTVLAVDATGIVGDSDTVTVDASRYSTLDLGAPDSPPTAATNVMPLWQFNQVALRAERWFGFTVARPGAVAALSGVAW